MLGGYEFLSLWRLVYQVKEYCNSSYCLLLVNSRYNFHYHLQLFSILMAACVFLCGKRTRPWKRNTHPVAVRHLHLRKTFFPFNYLTTIHVLTGFQISVYLLSSRVNTHLLYRLNLCKTKNTRVPFPLRITERHLADFIPPTTIKGSLCRQSAFAKDWQKRSVKNRGIVAKIAAHSYALYHVCVCTIP